MALSKEKKSQKELIRELYKIVQVNKSDLDAAVKGSYVTDGIFRFGNNTPLIDIKTNNNISQLRDIVAFLLEKESYSAAANKKLNLPEEPFKWMGATVENWASDVSVRITKLKEVEKRAELKLREERLLQMDPALLMEIELEEMSAALKG